MTDIQEIVSAHLRTSKDIESLIIKGHLLTEYCLGVYIDSRAAEKLDKNSKLSYYDKVDVCQILGLFKKRPELKEELLLLNKLRNSLAHNLEYNKEAFKQFLKVYDTTLISEFLKLSQEFIMIDTSLDEEQYLGPADGKEESKPSGRKIRTDNFKFILVATFICGKINEYVELAQPIA